MEKKITKRQYFEALRAVVENVESAGDISADEMLEFIDKEVATLDKKAEAARKRAEKKNAEGDELRQAIKAVLTDEYQNIDQITAQLDIGDLTAAKIVARVNQLVRNEEAEKTSMKDEESGRRLMFYRLVDSEDVPAKED